jgi:hypothetical protein
MKKCLLLAPVLLMALGLAAGCGKSGAPLEPAAGPGPSAADEAALSTEAARQPEFVEDGFYESPDQVPLALSSQPGTSALQAAIEPIAFWRAIYHVERRFEFAFADTDSTGRPTTGIMTIHKFLAGTFNILVPDTSGGFERTVIRKRLADHWVRRLLFKRVWNPEHERALWRLAAASGVKVTSRGHTTEILSLRIEGSGRDSTITDPLAFFRLRGLLRLDPASEVRVTVTTTRPDDIVLLLAREHRRRLHPNGDNTYSGVFRVPEMLGVRHVGVNALSRGTLYDDEAPYDSQAWIIPYLVGGHDVAADLY